MAHELDMTTGRAAIAFATQTPWHGLGFQVDSTAGLSTWQKAAGLDWYAKRALVQGVDATDGSVISMPERHVLYRSDTRVPLSVVSADYQIVQPSDVLEIFRQVVEAGGFEMETLGALREGRRIWGLAKINDGAAIVRKGKQKDIVKPYLLLATSFDGSLPTIGSLTAIRVVCANTLRASVGEAGQGADIRLSHSSKFDAAAMRKRLGVFTTAWEKFEIEAGLLSEKSMSDQQADEFLCALIEPLIKKKEDGTQASPRDSKGYAQILELFNGRARGAALAGRTAWGMLNATTEYLDHEVGRSADSRLNQAWFGAYRDMKEKARKLLVAA